MIFKDVEHIVIAQCTGQKRDGEWSASLLYDESDYFCKQRAYAAQTGDLWFIQSAKHGLVWPEDIVESYDMHVSEIDDIDQWATEITGAICEFQFPPLSIELLGGKTYTDPLRPKLEDCGYEVIEPLRGMGIGKRKQKLIEWADV